MIVYLDSQDFSHMANPPASADDFYSCLESELATLVADKVIEVRYSAVHISEIAHTRLEATGYSAGRAEALKRLSNGKCMRIWNDILKNEIECHFDPTKTVQATRESNRWLEVDDISMGNFLEKLRTSMQETMKERGYNRKARRSLAKVDLAANITKTAAGIAALDSIVENLNNKYPLEKELDRNTLVAYVTGTIGTKKFEEYFRSLIVDPVNLIARIAPELDQSLRLPGLVRNIGKSLMDKVNPSIKKISQLFEAMPVGSFMIRVRELARSMPVTTMKQVRRNMIRDILSDVNRNIVHLAKDYTDGEFDQMNLPATDVMFGALTKYISNVVSAAEAGKPIRLFKPSDAADLIHATYVPYVDIFRCDTAWTNIFKIEGMRFGTEVVGRVEDLMPAIRRRATLA